VGRWLLLGRIGGVGGKEEEVAVSQALPSGISPTSV
jgi:hypothetical protein